MSALLLLAVTTCTTLLAQQLHGPARVALRRKGPALTLSLHLVGALQWLWPSPTIGAVQWLLSSLPLWLLLVKLVKATSGPGVRPLPLRGAASADLLAAAAALLGALSPTSWARTLQGVTGCGALLTQARLLRAIAHDAQRAASPPQPTHPPASSPGAHADQVAKQAQAAKGAAAAPTSSLPQQSQQQAARQQPGLRPRPSQVMLLLLCFQATKLMQLATVTLGGLGVLGASNGAGTPLLVLCNLALCFVWPQVAAVYVLMLQFACKVTERQQRLLRALVKLPMNSTLPSDIGVEATVLLEVLRNYTSRKRSSSEAVSESNTPRPSVDNMDLDLGSLYRISEGSEKQAQDPDVRLELQHLLLVANSGSALLNPSSSWAGSTGSTPANEGRASAKMSLDSPKSQLDPPLHQQAPALSPRPSRLTEQQQQPQPQADISWSEPTKQEIRAGAGLADAGVQCRLLDAPQRSSNEGGGALRGGSVAAGGLPVLQAAGQQEAAEGGNDTDAHLQRLRALVAVLQGHASDVAHDLKNPLNGVLALSQNVLQGSFGEVPPAASKQLGVVHACGHHLLNMINMARDMLRGLDSGDWELSASKVQVSTPIDEVLKRMSPMVGDRITVHCNRNEAHTVFADGARLHQIVHVVLVNAFKYTRKGSVTIDTESDGGTGHVTLRVSDTGPGFTHEQLDKFNSPLTGGPDEQVGLGLMMVKRLMASFGGRLRIRNMEGKADAQLSGAVVDLVFNAERGMAPVAQWGSSGATQPPYTLPASPATQPAHQLGMSPSTRHAPLQEAMPAPSPAHAAEANGNHAPVNGGSKRESSSSACGGKEVTSANSGQPHRQPTHAHPPGRKRLADGAYTHVEDECIRVGEGQGHTILIVDDDPINVSILQDLLHSVGYKTLVGGTGTEGLEMYVSADPPVKLVLLDVTLPDMSGHEVCTKMRSLTPGVPPPIIMISGRASTKDVIKGLQAGSQDYVCKPFQPQEVLARIETQLRLYMGEMQQLQDTAEHNAELMKQVLPPHVLASLAGGSRILVEKIPSACLLQVEVVGFSALAAHADTSDCILMLNQIFSVFDQILDLHGVHKIDTVGATYLVAAGHLADESDPQGQPGRLLALLRCGTSMLEAVSCMHFPEAVGMMEVRMGLHMGPLYSGVLGIKLPRYCLFGTTQRLTTALQQAALPMTIHISEIVYSKLKAVLGEASFVLYTSSTLPGMGIFKTYLVLCTGYDTAALSTYKVLEYLEASALQGSAQLQVLQTFIGNRAANPKHLQVPAAQAPAPTLQPPPPQQQEPAHLLSLADITQAHAEPWPPAIPLELPIPTHSAPEPSPPQAQPRVSAQEPARPQPLQAGPLRLPTREQLNQPLQPPLPSPLLPAQLNAPTVQQHHAPQQQQQQQLLPLAPPEGHGPPPRLNRPMKLPSPSTTRAAPLASISHTEPPSATTSQPRSEAAATSSGSLALPQRQQHQPQRGSLGGSSSSSSQVVLLGAQAPAPPAYLPLQQQQQQQQLVSHAAQHEAGEGVLKPASLYHCLQPLGMGHYAKVLEGEGVGLAELARMDDGEMRRAGLVTERARKLIKEELLRVGLRGA